MFSAALKVVRKCSVNLTLLFSDTQHLYPSSSHYTRNWDKLVVEIKEEEKNEKLEGDAALNKLFQQIYSDGTDEVKRAMNKSFVSSRSSPMKKCVTFAR